MQFPLYAKPTEYCYCSGTRSIAHTGEVLPQIMGEMMLIVVGVGPVKSGYSPLCTHSFITSGALTEPLLAHYPMVGPPCVVNCEMGSTLQALGSIVLPVLIIHNGPNTSPASNRHALGAATAAGGSDVRRHEVPIIVMLNFVVVEGQTKECMLDTDAMSRLGLQQKNLAHPICSVNDPGADFQRACLTFHRSTNPHTKTAFYPVPEGALPPRYTFGIGQSIVRKVKGVLIRQDDATGQNILTATPVLEGGGLNVLEQSSLLRRPNMQTTNRCTGTVLLEKRVESTGEAAENLAPSWRGAVQGLLQLRGCEDGEKGRTDRADHGPAGQDVTPQDILKQSRRIAAIGRPSLAWRDAPDMTDMASATVTATRGADKGNVASIPAQRDPKTLDGHERDYIDPAKHAAYRNHATVVWSS